MRTLTYGALRDQVARRAWCGVRRRRPPKTRAGKIMRRLLREVAERGTVTGDTTGLEDAESIHEVLRGVRGTGSPR